MIKLICDKCEKESKDILIVKLTAKKRLENDGYKDTGNGTAQGCSDLCESCLKEMIYQLITPYPKAL